MSIIKKPVITEKMTEASEKNNRFGFVVDRRANKLEIKDAVEKMYGVSVEKVRTMIYPGKAKSRNTIPVLVGLSPYIYGFSGLSNT